jgi:hypothetical protein
LDDFYPDTPYCIYNAFFPIRGSVRILFVYHTAILIGKICFARRAELDVAFTSSSLHYFYTGRQWLFSKDVRNTFHTMVAESKGIPAATGIPAPLITTPFSTPTSDIGNSPLPNVPSGCNANIGASIVSPSKITIF